VVRASLGLPRAQASPRAEKKVKRLKRMESSGGDDRNCSSKKASGNPTKKDWDERKQRELSVRPDALSQLEKTQ